MTPQSIVTNRFCREASCHSAVTVRFVEMDLLCGLSINEFICLPSPGHTPRLSLPWLLTSIEANAFTVHRYHLNENR